MFGGFTGLTMTLYLIAYLFCLFTDKDALRSETYSIQKLAIEKGFIGDSLVGKINLNNDEEKRLIEATPSTKDEEARNV